MRVTGINNQLASASSRMRPGVRDAATTEAGKASESAATGRALIPVSPVRTSERPAAAVRQPASFLAHLIATEQAIPQTRERRRIEPNVAAAIYAAARESVPAQSGHALSRAM
jgi:hypothetical protein